MKAAETLGFSWVIAFPQLLRFEKKRVARTFRYGMLALTGRAGFVRCGAAFVLRQSQGQPRVNFTGLTPSTRQGWSVSKPGSPASSAAIRPSTGFGVCCKSTRDAAADRADFTSAKAPSASGGLPCAGAARPSRSRQHRPGRAGGAACRVHRGPARGRGSAG